MPGLYPKNILNKLSTESGTLGILSFVQGLESPEEGTTHPKGFDGLLNTVYGLRRQGPLGKGWEMMFMTQIASVAREQWAGCETTREG